MSLGDVRSNNLVNVGNLNIVYLGLTETETVVGGINLREIVGLLYVEFDMSDATRKNLIRDLISRRKLGNSGHLRRKSKD